MTAAPPYALLALREAGGDVILKVRASPGASRDRVAGMRGDALKLLVSAPPEKGKANEAMARLLARHLGLGESRVMLHSGETSRDKWFRVEGMTANELRKVLVERA